MRRFPLILIAILGLALLAAACGSDDDSTEVTSDTSADDGDDAAEQPDDNSSADDDAPVDEPADDDAGLPLGAGPYPIADVTFVVDLGDGSPTEYRLACLGDTATFTGDPVGLDAGAACTSLTESEVRDRLTTDQHLDRICTEIYGGPETAQISGTLNDTPIDTAIDRANGCGIDDWDRLLRLLLPPTAG